MKEIQNYCLKCYTPLANDLLTCSLCGFKNQKWLRKRYWNLNRKLLFIEYALKSIIAAVCTVVSIAAVKSFRGDDVGFDWIIAVPIVALCFGLWETASKITKRIPYFSPTLFWSGTFVLLSFAGLAIDIRMTIGSLVLAVLVNVAGSEFEKWKSNKIRKF